MVAVDAKSRLAIELVLQDLATRDLQRFGRIVKKTTAEGTSNFRRMTRSIGKAGVALGGLAVGMVSFALIIRGFRSTLKAGFGFVDASAEFEEAASKFGVVFGEFASSAASELDNLAEAVGRPRTELINFASTFQDTLVPMGLIREEAAGLSVELTALAIDVASFSNKLDSDVVRDFQSALVGNTETVRKYGIVINVANTEQEAYRLGLAKAGEEISEVAKIQARLSLITQGSSDAIGDAERTAGSYQNTMKRLRGEIGEARVVFGQLIQKEILDTIDKFGGLDVIIDQVRIGFGFVTGVTRKFVRAAGRVVENLSLMIDRFGGASALAKAFAGELLTLNTFMTLFADAIVFAGKLVGVVFQAILDTTRELFKRLLASLKQDFFTGLLLSFADTLEAIARIAEDNKILDAIIPTLEIKKAAFLLRVESSAMLNLLKMDNREAGTNIADVWTDTFSQMGDEAGNFFETFKSRLKSVAAEGLELDFDLSSFFPDSPAEAAEPARALGNVLGGIFGTAFGIQAETAIKNAMVQSIVASKEEAVQAAQESGAAAGKAWAAFFKPFIVQGVKAAAEELRRQQTFFAGFADAFERIGERLSDQNLGASLAFQTFGALNSGLDQFSRDLVEGKANFSDFAKSLIKDIGAIIIKTLLLRGIRDAFGFANGGVADGNMVGSESFAAGGIMPGGMGKPLPIKRYARGGIANTPQVAIFGEGSSSAEAFVPLGGDRKIPVKMEGGGGVNAVVNLTITSLDPRGAAEVFLEQFPLIEKKLAASIQAGTNRSLTTAIRSSARGGR